MAAVTELLSDEGEAREKLVERLHSLHKKLKYGLPSPEAIMVYELGFSDRVVAQDIAINCGIAPTTRRRRLLQQLRSDRIKPSVNAVLQQYPAYYRSRFEELVRV